MEQRHWDAVVVTAVAIFVLVTSEMLPVGLLDAIARELRVSVGVAGTTLTAPGLIAAFTAPALPITAWRVDRRWLLSGLMMLLAVGNTLCALAPSFSVLFAARVFVGISIGGSWGLAGGVSSRLVTGPRSGRAIAIIFGGVSVATVLGVPAGSLIGDAFGWRTAFGVSAATAAVLALLMVRTLPALPGSPESSPAALLQAVRNPGVRAGLLITAFVVVAHFAAYTFVGPILRASAGVQENALGTQLLAFGVAGVAGNFSAGMFILQNPRRVLQVVSLLLGVAMLALPAVAVGVPSALAIMALWGLSYGAIGVSIQAWVSRASPEAVEPASAMSACVFNFSIALGSFTGGRIVDHVGTLSVLTMGGSLALLAAVIAQVTRPEQAA